MLVTVRCGDARVLARVTREACDELGLRAGTSVWALVKAASLRGHVFHSR
jgi:molybdate transport system ATP-binding protein